MAMNSIETYITTYRYLLLLAKFSETHLKVYPLKLIFHVNKGLRQELAYLPRLCIQNENPRYNETTGTYTYCDSYIMIKLYYIY